MRLSLGVLAGGAIPLAKAGPAPRRVISLFQGATDTAVALGIRPAGVVDPRSEKPMYRYLRPVLAGVAHTGLETQPSLADIALLSPDLIVASRFRRERIAGLLEQPCRQRTGQAGFRVEPADYSSTCPLTRPKAPR